MTCKIAFPFHLWGRETLPIYPYQEEILQAVKHHQIKFLFVSRLKCIGWLLHSFWRLLLQTELLLDVWQMACFCRSFLVNLIQLFVMTSHNTHLIAIVLLCLFHDIFDFVIHHLWCFLLYTSYNFHPDLEDNTLTQIQRIILANVVLSLKRLGIYDIVNFDFIDHHPWRHY